MPRRKVSLPIVVEKGHVTGRGKVQFTALGKGFKAGTSGAGTGKRTSSVGHLNHSVKRLRLFSPPKEVTLEILSTLEGLNKTSNDQPVVAHTNAGPSNSYQPESIGSHVAGKFAQPVPNLMNEPPPQKPKRQTKVEPPVHIMLLILNGRFKTSNQYLKEWQAGHCQLFLDALYTQEHISHHGPHQCQLCGTDNFVYRCQDCTQGCLLCKECILDCHSQLPFHAIQQWSGTHFKDVSLTSLGFVLELGHEGNQCDLTIARGKDEQDGKDGKDKEYGTHEIIIGDVNGFQTLRVRYCQHFLSPPNAVQLLNAGLYPATFKQPQTAFTIRLLKHYSICSSQAKVSSERYYHVLERLTNNMKPHNVDDRYREFMRCCREWIHLQDLKHQGAHELVNGKPAKALTLGPECPACPRPGVNFEFKEVTEDEMFLFRPTILLDGNFHQVRKANPYDQDDTCLSDGHKYFVEDKPYLAFLKIHEGDTPKNQAEKPECNEMKAVTQQFVKFKGLDVTGIACAACRHEFFIHHGTVNFHAGERYVYTDYLIASVLHHQALAGHTTHGITYDIFCHWFPRFLERLTGYGKDLPFPLPQGLIVGGVPKFHLAAHKEECYIRYSLNNLPGFGRLDGEALERIWSSLNAIAGSASEKSPGARIDQLGHLQADWNWVKFVQLVKYLPTRFWSAVKSFQETKESWEAMNALIPTETAAYWADMDTSPQKLEQGWTSVFSSLKTPSSEIVQAATSTSGTQEDRSSCGLLESVLKMETDVYFIEKIKSRHSKTPTQPQLQGLNKLYLKLDEDRKRILMPYLSLLGDIDHEHASLVSPDSKTALLAPSQIPPIEAAVFPGWKSLCSLELELRKEQALQALHDIRAACAVKALLLRGKNKLSHSQKKKTRAQGLVDTQTDAIAQGTAFYSLAQKAYSRLTVQSNSPTKLPVLTPVDISNALSILVADRSTLHEGQRTLPWFFRPPYCLDWDLQSDANTMEVARLEWFRGRERWKRWEEELKLLKADMKRTLRYIDQKHNQWLKQAVLALETGGKIQRGFAAYCHRQACLNQELLEYFKGAFDKCLKVSDLAPLFGAWLREGEKDETVQVKWGQTH